MNQEALEALILMTTIIARTTTDWRRRVGALVIGAGGAGLRAAIELDAHGSDVLVVGKRARADAHTVLAAGGINAALGTMDSADTWQIHAADTLREGRFLGDAHAVEILCREAPAAIDDLLSYGTQFARGADGRLLQRYFGAHRYRRTLFAGDYTGRAMIAGLMAEVDRRGIPILEQFYVSDLLQQGDGRVSGVLGFALEDGATGVIDAGVVVLATGGHIGVYGRSSSRPAENTGDGMALAYRAGAELADMELVQFHPTGMVWPDEAVGTLVTEAVRGEGGRLYNSAGERFMARYDRERLELSTRDRIALANYTEIVEGRGTPRHGVWLDISHVPAATIHERLPRMVAQYQDAGIDITRAPMEVAPTAHYAMGGIRVAVDTHWTGVPGLYAAGEAASGVHGANRLGGNSLAEIIVFGRRAGLAAANDVAETRSDDTVIAERLTALTAAAHGALAPVAGIDRLRETMWRQAALVRDAAGLHGALDTIEELGARRDDLRIPDGVGRPAALAAAYDLTAMLVTAEATVRGALLREESRGAHVRREFPTTARHWQRTIVMRARNGRMHADTRPLPEPSADVTAALRDKAPVLGGLLE